MSHALNYNGLWPALEKANIGRVVDYVAAKHQIQRMVQRKFDEWKTNELAELARLQNQREEAANKSSAWGYIWDSMVTERQDEDYAQFGKARRLKSRELEEQGKTALQLWKELNSKSRYQLYLESGDCLDTRHIKLQNGWRARLRKQGQSAI